MKYTYIEGQTPLDEEEKLALIPDLFTQQELDIFEEANILEARDWIMKKSVLNRSDLFSEKFLIQLHKKMFGNVWKWAGQFRHTNKNIGVDSYQISTELYKLLGDVRYWLDHKVYSITDLAVIFHHRLVKIHLFPNGNGRHARMVADAIVAKSRNERLTWGGNAILNKQDEIRKQYIAALRNADCGDYTALLKFACS